MVGNPFEGMRESWQKLHKDIEEHTPPGMKKSFLKSFMASEPYVWHMLILASVTKKETYGYEIISMANAMRLDGQPQISASKVYPVFHELEKGGYIKGKWSERKKVYTITPEGKELFKLVKKVARECVVVEAKMFSILFNEKVKL